MCTCSNSPLGEGIHLEQAPHEQPILLGGGNFFLIDNFLLSSGINSSDVVDIEALEVMFGLGLPGRALTRSCIDSNTTDDCIIANSFWIYRMIKQ